MEADSHSALQLVCPAGSLRALPLAVGAGAGAGTDRLLFDHSLVMQGDIEFGLVPKNRLDAVGPLWR